MHTPSYFIIMRDFGKIGREAVVDPEMTYRGVIEAVTEANRGRSPVLFVHHIHDGTCEDITEQVFDEIDVDVEQERSDPIADSWDHMRDLYKHEVE